MNRKGFAPILIIVIVAIMAVLGGWYYVKKSSVPLVPQPVITNTTSTKNAMVDWLTYRNIKQKPGYQFQYPVEASLVADTEDGREIPAQDVSLSMGVKMNGNRTFSVQFLANLNTIEPISNQIDRLVDIYFNTTPPKSVSRQPIVLAGADGRKIKISGSADPNVSNKVWYLVGVGNVVYEITQLNEQDPIQNQILSTFKFIEPTTSVDTSISSCVPSSCWGHLGCNYYTCTNGTSTYTKFVN